MDTHSVPVHLREALARAQSQAPTARVCVHSMWVWMEWIRHQAVDDLLKQRYPRDIGAAHESAKTIEEREYVDKEALLTAIGHRRRMTDLAEAAPRSSPGDVLAPLVHMAARLLLARSLAFYIFVACEPDQALPDPPVEPLDPIPTLLGLAAEAETNADIAAGILASVPSELGETYDEVVRVVRHAVASANLVVDVHRELFVAAKAHAIECSTDEDPLGRKSIKRLDMLELLDVTSPTCEEAYRYRHA
eukprot:CAMPEP_0185184124 /NCGR_PEP_ID=MMETSP1140-20130426/2394_1 /TAXON_ID=298111 /ORGANISM="Pavlova sp., Strain CCMP459" /LENGTH=247 /DNA_ID=CAMNT_0027750179 /DNA_START=40 /DNA_END=779 /DNA_ORIENTATION=+